MKLPRIQVNEIIIGMTIVAIYAALQLIGNVFEHYRFENFRLSPSEKMMKRFYWKMVNIQLFVWTVMRA